MCRLDVLVIDNGTTLHIVQLLLCRARELRPLMPASDTKNVWYAFGFTSHGERTDNNGTDARSNEDVQAHGYNEETNCAHTHTASQ